MKRIHVCFIVAAVLAVSSHDRASGEDSYAICFRPAEEGFQELELQDEICEILVGKRNVRVVGPQDVDSILRAHPGFGSGKYEPGTMAEIARLTGVRYLIWLKVKKAGIEQANRTLIPYVFRSHHRRYVLGVRMFVLDSQSEETIMSEYIESRRSGPCALSYLDFDSNHPDLIQEYSIVRSQFKKMEKELAENISGKVLKVTRQR